MKTLFLLTLIATGICTAFAQEGIDDILGRIEQSNTTLAAIRAVADAEKTGNKTGLLPPDPEVEFNYLWGNPSAIGNRTDFAILQSFDFPTAYTYRSQIATLKDEQAELEYLRQRNELFHEARMLLAGLTYHNALMAEYTIRLQHAVRMAGNYKKMLDAGEGNILDFNKAMVNRLSLASELENLEIERNMLLAGLERLNGGNAVEFSDSTFAELPLTAGFEQWVEQAGMKNPALLLLKQEVAVSKKQAQLNKALSLPKFHAGYMSEKIVGEQFQGITAGVSIPLWESKNTVKYARASAQASASRYADLYFQYYNEIKNLYQKAVALQSSTTEYQARLQEYSNRALLDKALAAGQISLSEYLLELAVYYQSANNLLEMKYNALVAWYTLQRYSQD